MEERFARLDLASLREYVDTFLEYIEERGGDGSAVSKRAHDSAKRKALCVITRYGAGSRYSEWLMNAMEAARKTLTEVEKGLSRAGYYVAKLNFRLDTPGLVGMGSGVFKSVFEVGLSIDPLLGLPYYPGSGIKGAVRGFAEPLLEDDDWVQLLKLMFGWTPGGRRDTGHVGLVFFSDMYPIGCSEGECSIYRGLVVTPHYHYHGNPVEDELQAYPEPVQHVGIEEGTMFQIVIGVREGPGVEEAYQKLENLAKNGRLPEPLKSVGNQLITDDHTYSILLTAAFLIWAALRSGIAARSGKGYNMMTPAEEPGKEKYTLMGYRYRKPFEEGEKQFRQKPGPHYRGGRRGNYRGNHRRYFRG